MKSDLDSEIQTLPHRLEELKNKINKISVYRDLLISQISNEQDKVKNLKYEAELQQKSSEIFKMWLEDLLKANIDSVSDLVTSGLNHIIDDQELKFNIKQEVKNNRLSINFTIEENGIEGDPLSSFGGGAISVASLILRLAVMARMNMANLLLLDESMSSLANRYVPMAAEFMKQISEKMGINILMVTHNEDFLLNAHTAYEGIVTTEKDQIKTLMLRRRSVQS